MPSYTAPTKDLQFVLHDVLKVTESKTPGYDELEPDFTSAILEEAGKLTSEVLAPLNAVGDQEGCRLESLLLKPDVSIWKIIRQRVALRPPPPCHAANVNASVY